jgi:hypothetical protein
MNQVSANNSFSTDDLTVMKSQLLIDTDVAISVKCQKPVVTRMMLMKKDSITCDLITKQ